MAEDSQQAQPQQAVALSATFPAPPPFYNHFTSENLERLKEVQQSQHQSLTKSLSKQTSQQTPPKSPIQTLTSLPPELRYLIPPPPPSTGTYRSFGDQYRITDTLPSLADEGIEQLYPSNASAAATPNAGDAPIPNESNIDGASPEWTLDRAFYLKKIAKSLLLSFMELVGILSVDPSQYGRKIEDLRTLFINAHHLLNEYRPHQARETLIMMMEEQLERSRRETAAINRMKEKVDSVLEGLEKEVVAAGKVSAGDDIAHEADDLRTGKEKDTQIPQDWRTEKEKRKNARWVERRTWEVLEGELGI
ncbi:MAG: Mediator of RNA polymerase II transcription subunit 7 [Sclerophora amabilis]|nr:MAG: Mediator of RNA polymerase II transcription subunit 7 [Sclerophora amabilis]